MPVEPDKSVPISLLVDRKVDPAARSVPTSDLAADLARSLLDGGAATCVTDRRGELV